jgi:gliding motility-associated-like protein
MYTVTLNETGCVAQDSVRVNVLDVVTVQLPNDTTICQGDSFSLAPVSRGLYYQWTPAEGLSDPTAKSTIAAPAETTTYRVTSNVGKCEAMAAITVNVAPYPQAAAGKDTIICYDTPAPLHATATASSFTWSPTTSLANGNTLQPVATPLQTTAYVLTAMNVSGCPKPVQDTVVVTVLPRITAFAGNDTNMVAGQPLQLHATGGASYIWSPDTGLSNAAIADPIVTLNGSADSITYVVVAKVEGCSDADSVTIRIFKSGANIFVPTAFTPNSDGRNDLLMPVLVGMNNLEFFKVYNRWGQLVFETNLAGRGWDGTISGKAQRTDVFVYMVQGIDYAGRKIFKKGTCTLIR